MPQWDLLDLLSSVALELPTFRLLMETEATGLVRDGDQVTGVVARGPDGEIEIEAVLTVAADGRSSTLRARVRPPRDQLRGPDRRACGSDSRAPR